MKYRESFAEKIEKSLAELAAENALPFVSAMVTGLAAYFYCFANKLEIMDDLACMFYHGDSVSSGRWGLDLSSRFLPGYSMPWLNGILSILFISAAVCVILKMFRIKSRLLNILLPAVIISFPSQICTFAYMFAAPHYAFSLLLAVLSAKCISKAAGTETAAGKPVLEKKQAIAAVLLLVCSLSIYQAYAAVSASLLIVFAFQQTLSKKNRANEILIKGAVYVALLAAAMALYYLITAIVKKTTGTEFNQYAENNLNNFAEALFGLRVAYTAFLGYFTRGYYDLILPGASRWANVGLILVSALAAAVYFIRGEKNREKTGRIWVAALCIVLLPAGINCMRIISSTFHNLMLFGFVSVYVLAAVIFENCMDSGKFRLSAPAKDLAALCLAVIAAVNINFANSVYLKMDIQFKQAQSFYTGMLARLSEDPEFNENSIICIVGDNDGLYPIPNIDTDDLSGIREGIIGVYSQRAFVKYFCGYDLKIADTDITDALEEDQRVIDMPQYPFAGSVQKIDGRFVIKVGNIVNE